MALINRMSRLLTADVHAVLDRLEEPEALLRQAVREMEEALERAERRTRSAEQDHDAIAARIRQVQRSLAELDAQLDAAFGAGDEPLARKLLRRKLETERLGTLLGERLAGLAQSLATERASIAEQREQLDVARQKAELFGNVRPARFCEDRFDAKVAVGEDEVEAALLRERQRRQRS